MGVLTVANQLTFLRILLIPAFVLLVTYGYLGWALLVFLTAGVTDALDGLIARRADQRTSLGAWLDPMADKLLLVTTFIVLTLPAVELANHTFQPRTGLRRVDLAAAVSRLLTVVAARDPELRARWAEAKPKIADVSVGHLSYPAVSLAVASGVMPLLEEDRFAVGRAVTGAEAVDVIGRVRMLARRSS